MQTADGGVDHVSAPQTYAELHTRYYDYVVALVHKWGIDDNRKEDVASDILLRFFERDFLHAFNPDLEFTHAGVTKKARFKSFLTKFVLIYLQGHRDKQRRQHDREVLIMDMPAHSDGTGPATSTWGDTCAPGHQLASHEDGLLNTMEDSALLVGLRDYLVSVPPRNEFDTCNLPALFDEVMVQIRERGAWDITTLREKFHVSSTAMHSWLWWLRENIAACLNRPLPPRRTRRPS